jgi:hypothetical protein
VQRPCPASPVWLPPFLSQLSQHFRRVVDSGAALVSVNESTAKPSAAMGSLWKPPFFVTSTRSHSDCPNRTIGIEIRA